MNQLNQVNIEEKRTAYDVSLAYRSDKKYQNYDAEIEGIEEADGTISISPDHCGKTFEFYHSDPDRVIAIAQMMMAFAQMAKKNNQKNIDTPSGEC